MRIYALRGQVSNWNLMRPGLAEAGFAESCDGHLPYKFWGGQKRPGTALANRYGMAYRGKEKVSNGSFELGTTSWTMTKVGGADGAWAAWNSGYHINDRGYHDNDGGFHNLNNTCIKVEHSGGTAGYIKVSQAYITYVYRNKPYWLRAWVKPTASCASDATLTLQTTGLNVNVSRIYTKAEIDAAADENGWTLLELRRNAGASATTDIGLVEIHVDNGGSDDSATFLIDDVSFAPEIAVTGIWQFHSRAVLRWAASALEASTEDEPSVEKLIQNGEFNPPAAGGSSGWTVGPMTVNDTGSFGFDTTIYRHETAFSTSVTSGKITHLTGSAGYACWQRVKLLAGVKYRFRVWVYVPSVNTPSEVTFHIQLGSTIVDSVSANLTVTDMWQPLTLTQLRAENAYMTLCVFCIKPEGSQGDLYVDDATTQVSKDNNSSVVVFDARDLSGDVVDFDDSGTEATVALAVVKNGKVFVLRQAKDTSGNYYLYAKDDIYNDEQPYVRVWSGGNPIRDLAVGAGYWALTDGNHLYHSSGKYGPFLELPAPAGALNVLPNSMLALEYFAGKLCVSAAVESDGKNRGAILTFDPVTGNWANYHTFNHARTPDANTGVGACNFLGGGNLWICLGAQQGDDVGYADVWYADLEGGWHSVPCGVGTQDSPYIATAPGQKTAIAFADGGLWLAFRNNSGEISTRTYAPEDTKWLIKGDLEIPFHDYGYLVSPPQGGVIIYTWPTDGNGGGGGTYIVYPNGDVEEINGGENEPPIIPGPPPQDEIDDNGDEPEETYQNPTITIIINQTDGKTKIIEEPDTSRYDNVAPLPTATERWGVVTLVATSDGKLRACFGHSVPRFEDLLADESVGFPGELHTIATGISSLTWPTATEFNGWENIFDGVTAVIRTDGERVFRAGIYRPDTAVTIAAGGPGNITGTYTVGRTWYDSITGYETAMSPLPKEDLTVSGEEINVTGLTTPPPRFDYTRIYRPLNIEIYHSYTMFFQEAQVPAGTTSVVLNKSDDDLLKCNMFDTRERGGLPPVRFACAHLDRLYMTGAFKHYGICRVTNGSTRVQRITGIPWTRAMESAYIIIENVKYDIASIDSAGAYLDLAITYDGSGGEKNFTMTYNPNYVFTTQVDVAEGAPLPEYVDYTKPIRIAVNDGDSIIGIAVHQDYVYAMKNRSIHRIVAREDGTDDVMQTHACVGGAHRTICRDSQGNLLFYSPERPGIWAFNGEQTIELTAHVRDWFEALAQEYDFDAHAAYHPGRQQYILYLSKNNRLDTCVIVEDSVIDELLERPFIGPDYRLLEDFAASPQAVPSITCSAIIYDEVGAAHVFVGDSAGHVWEEFVGTEDSGIGQSQIPVAISQSEQMSWRWKSLPFRAPESEQDANREMAAFKVDIVGSAPNGVGNLLASDAAAGQKNVVLVSAVGFAVGDLVYLRDDDGHYEPKFVASINSNTLAMTQNLTYGYSVAANAKAFTGALLVSIYRNRSASPSSILPYDLSTQIMDSRSFSTWGKFLQIELENPMPNQPIYVEEIACVPMFQPRQ